MQLVEQFISFLKEQKRKPSKLTVKNYKADINQFIRWFEERFRNSFDPNKATFQVLDLYKDSQSFSASSMERHLSSLRKFFNFLKLEGIISQSPFGQSAMNHEPKTIDPYHIKDFKDFLYVYNASHLTIKNYIIDIKQFFKWAQEVSGIENAWDLREKNLLAKIDSSFIEEYKNRLLEQEFLPSTVNRKLSSLRKYFTWAQTEGLLGNGIIEVRGETSLTTEKGSLDNLISDNQNVKDSRSRISNFPHQEFQSRYSPFPPIRLAQKFANVFEAVFDYLVITPLAKLGETFEYVFWNIQGKPVFQNQRSKIKDQKYNDKLKIGNLRKEMFAPLSISTKSFPWHKKAWHHIRHTRPKWYRTYHSYPITHYFHLAILIIFMTAVGFALYNAFATIPQSQSPAFAAPVAPPRILSFQGRLTDSSDNPVTTAATAMRMAIYNDPTASGAALLWQEIVSVSPDTDGIFSILLGNNTAITQSIFAQNATLYLGVTVGSTAELTPRQQLATVAFATNAEVLQGLPPVTDAGVTTNTNAVLALNSSGTVSIAGTATTTFQAASGQLTITGKPLLLQTNSGTGGNITLAPDGLGTIDFQKPIQNSTNNNNISTAVGALEVNDLLAILATSSGQSALTINQTSTGPLISASTSGTAKFTVDNSGNGYFAGNVGIGITTPAAKLDISDNSANPALKISQAGAGLSASFPSALDSASGLKIGTAADSTVLHYTTAGAASADFNGLRVSNPGGYGSVRLDYLYVASAIYGLTNGSALLIETRGAGDLDLSTETGKIDLQDATYNSTANNGGAVYVNDTFATSGNVGIGITAPIAALDVRGLSGTLPAATVSATSSFASLVVDNAGVGDLFTASKSGATKFVVTNAGNVGIGINLPAATLDVVGTLKVSSTTNFGGIAYTWPGSQTTNYVLQTNGSGTLSWVDANAAAASTIYWNQGSGLLFPKNSTVDLTIGGQSTASAKFAFINMAGGTPTASISGNLSLAVPTTAGANTFNLLNNSTLNFQRSPGGDAGLAANSVLFLNSNGNVGIGTTSPGTTLDVTGTGRFSSTLTASNGFTQTTGALNLTSTSGAVALTLSSSATAFNVNSGVFDIDTANSRVGIGTTGPLSKLDVRGITQIADDDVLSNTSAYASFGVTRANVATNNSYIGLTKIDTIPWGIGINSSSSLIFGVASLSPARTIPTPLVTIQSSGNVGIGNTAPLTALDVTGSASLSANLSLRGAGTAHTFNVLDNGTLNFQRSPSGDAGLAANSVLYLGNNGNVGIGTTAPSALFSVGSSSQFQVSSSGVITAPTSTNTINGLVINSGALSGITTLNMSGILTNSSAGNAVTLSGAGANLAFTGAGLAQITTASNQHLALMPGGTGNVGIGTTSPLAALDLRGNSGTTPIASFSGRTSFAGLVVDNGLLTTDLGDLITASSSAYPGQTPSGGGDKRTQFRVTNQGTIYGRAFYDIDNSAYFLDPASTGNALLVNGNVGIGTTSPLAALDIRGLSGTLPAATVSATSSFASLIVDNAGVGDLFTASKSGATKFVIQNSGNVGIATASAYEKLEVYGGNILVDRGHFKFNREAAPSTVPTYADSGVAGNLNGSYSYGVSFVTASGESGGLASGVNVSVTLKKMSVSNIPTGSSAVIARKLYRTAAGGANPRKFVATISDNTTTTYTDNTADVDLGAAMPNKDSTAGSFYIDEALVFYPGETNSYNFFAGLNAGLNSGGQATFNTGVGVSALKANTTGSSSTAVGALALTSNTTGGNDAFGFRALFSNTTGGSNVALGSQALYRNNTGNHNIGIGANAEFGNNDGHRNTIIGSNAFVNGNSSHSDNIGIGYIVGDLVTTGSRNVLIGSNVATTMTTGSDNILIGYNVQPPAVDSTYRLNIGDTIYGDLSTDKIGIGNATPLTALDVTGSASLSANLSLRGAATSHTFNILDNGTLNFQRSPSGDAGLAANSVLYLGSNGNVGIGTTGPSTALQVYRVNSGGAGPILSLASDGGAGTTTAINFSPWLTRSGGASAAIIGKDDGNFSGNLLFQTAPTGDQANTLATRMIIDSSGNVGIGTTSPLARFDVRGDNGTTPAASVSAQTSFAALITDNSGVGDLFTASKSGATKFVVTNAGNVGIGTNVPGAALAVSGGNNINERFPDGLIATAVNTSVTTDAGSSPLVSYTVTTGKTFYITSTYVVTSACALQVGSKTYTTGTGIHSFGAPLLAGSAVVVSATGTSCTINVNGFEATAGVTAKNVTVSTDGGDVQTTYTVTTGKTFYITNVFTNSASNFQIGGKTYLPVSTEKSFTSPLLAGSGVVLSSLGTSSTANVNGYETKSTGLGGADVAEQYFVVGGAEPGDVISMDSLSTSAFPAVSKTIKSYDQKVMGVITTNPGITLADDTTRNSDKPTVSVALNGRVPVKVSTENGQIQVGDPLTSSSTPGVAMKATKAGPIVAKALEPFDFAQGGQGRILAFVNVSWYDPDVFITSTGDYSLAAVNRELGIMDQATDSASIIHNSLFVIQNSVGQVIDRIGAFAEIAVANLRAGFIDAQQITTNTLTALTANIEQITTNSLAVTADSVTIEGENIRDYIINVVNESINNGAIQQFSNRIISPIASIDRLKTDFISPLASDSAIALSLDSSKFIVHSSNDASSSAVAVIDNQGNASFAGQLTSNSLTTNSDATVGGTLRAKKIIADQIEGLNIQTSTLSAQYITNNYYDNFGLISDSASSSGIPNTAYDIPASSQGGQNTGFVDIASLSGQLAYVENLNAAFATFTQGIVSLGPSSFTDLSVINQLSIGGNLILADASINVLGSDLKLQPLKQGGLSIMGDLVYIDTFGNIKVGGNAEFAKDVTIQGKLSANIISPIPGSDFVIQNSSDSALFTINSVGTATFSGQLRSNELLTNELTARKLNFGLVQPALAISNTELLATGSAGVATISAHQTEVTIKNNFVTDKSLIYITPVGQPSTNTPYLIRQVPSGPALSGVEGSFTAGIQSETNVGVPFNWLIIN